MATSAPPPVSFLHLLDHVHLAVVEHHVGSHAAAPSRGGVSSPSTPITKRSAHQPGAGRRAEADRALREDDHGIADPHLPPDSAPAKPVEAMSARSTTCSSVRPSGILRQVGLGIGDQQVFGLRAVDRVAEAPAADRLVAPAVAALRLVLREAGAALAAGGDGADEHPVADLVARHAGSQLFDHADRLVADDQARAHRILAAQDVQVGAADRRPG